MSSWRRMLEHDKIFTFINTYENSKLNETVFYSYHKLKSQIIYQWPFWQGSYTSKLFLHCWWAFKQGSLVICLYPVVKSLLVWRVDSERNRTLFPASENRLLPRDVIPGPRVNAICLLISPESKLPLCLVSIYTWFVAMPDSAWHRLWSIFFLSCAIPGLCFRTTPYHHYQNHNSMLSPRVYTTEVCHRPTLV